MIAQRGTFVKTNGEERQMNFIRLKNLPKDFIEKNTLGTGTAPNLSEGQELVWDLDASGFRVFNWETALGDVVEYRLPNKQEETSENSEIPLNNTTEIV
jgi:hypothetical protein